MPNIVIYIFWVICHILTLIYCAYYMLAVGPLLCMCLNSVALSNAGCLGLK